MITTAPSISENHVAARWARLGALFNVHPAKETPDLELLLLDTVTAAHLNSRLFTMAATWLAHYSECVAKRRLTIMIREHLENQHRPTMGFLLEWVQIHGNQKGTPFRTAIQQCRPATPPGPLSAVSRRNPALHRLSKETASPLSRKWGCWLEEFDLKTDAIRPAEWIGKSNPALAVRAITGGDLVATIAADAAAGQNKFPSESDLARRYGASRAAVRTALHKLTLAGYVQQPFRGKSKTVQLSVSYPKPAR